MARRSRAGARYSYGPTPRLGCAWHGRGAETPATVAARRLGLSDCLRPEALEALLGYFLPRAGDLLLSGQPGGAAQFVDHVRVGAERHLWTVAELLRQLGDRRALP